MYEGRLRSFSLHHTARSPVNGARSGSHENHLEPAINDGPNNKIVCVLHSAKVLQITEKWLNRNILNPSLRGDGTRCD